MNNILKSIRRYLLSISLFLSFAILLIIAFLYSNYANKNMENNFKKIAQVQELKLIDKDIDNFINIKLGYVNYDETVKNIKSFEGILNRLDNEKGLSLRLFNDRVINNKLDSLIKEFKAKKMYVERFKSHKSITNNSLRYLADLHKDISYFIHSSSSSQEKNKDIEALVDEVINTLSMSNIDKSIDLKGLQPKLALLKYEGRMDKAFTENVRFFKTHILSIIENHEEMKSIISEISKSGLFKAINDLEETLIVYFEDIKIRQKIIGNLLFMTSFAFFIALIIFQIKEQKNKNRLTTFSSAIENSDNSVVITDLKGNISYVNKAFEENTGYNAAEAIGENPSILKSGIQSEEYYKELWDTISIGKKWQGEFWNKRKNGTIFCEKTTISPVFNLDGTFNSYLAIKLDITKEKDMLKELEDLNKTLEQQVEELSNLSSSQNTINSLLRLSMENITFEEQLNSVIDETLSVPWLQIKQMCGIFLVEDDPDVLILKAHRNLQSEILTLCEEVPLGRCLCGRAALNGKIEFSDCIDKRHEILYEGIPPHGHYCVPLMSGDNILGVIVVYLNEGHKRNGTEEEFLQAVSNTLAGIIQRSKTEKEKDKIHTQLLQAQKMEAVGNLAGGIAHDFNNILTAIIGYGNLLQMKIKKDDPIRPYMSQILASSERAANLTQSLLAFSRKQIINPKPVNLNEIVKGVEKLLLRLIGEDIEFKTMLSEEDLTVMVDSGQIDQVLMNLATNSRDAMPDGGYLTIETKPVKLDYNYIKVHGYGEVGMYAFVSITDTGMGMDEKTRKSIFEPFFTTKEVGKGTGLGLAMVYGIIKQHNGYINVYSELGKGTTFKIYLPKIKSWIEEIEHEVLLHPKGGTETILVAEDDDGVRRLVRDVFEGNGYKVIETVDGEEAIKVFDENRGRIDMIFLDTIMPKKNGMKAYEEMKKIDPDIKTLFMSGYTRDMIHKKGVLEEGLNFISKPLSPVELLRKAREILDKE